MLRGDESGETEKHVNSVILLLLLYISGHETKDPSKVHLSTAALKPEETCKQGCLLCEPETPTLPR